MVNSQPQDVQLNLQALDKLVLDTLSAQPSPLGAKDPLLQARACIARGDIDAAISTLSKVPGGLEVSGGARVLGCPRLRRTPVASQVAAAAAPLPTQDLRIVFRLHKARFVEILRDAQGEGVDRRALGEPPWLPPWGTAGFCLPRTSGPHLTYPCSAPAPATAACAREQLAPMALDAYPEAYTEFKRLLMLLLYTQAAPAAGAAASRGGDASGAASTAAGAGAAGMQAELAEVLSEGSRQELAELVYQTLRKQQGGWGRQT